MSPLEAKLLWVVTLIIPFLVENHRCLEAATPNNDHPITLADCPSKCGSISIPYPFGTKAGCFIPGFEVVCNDTFNPPRVFIANPDLDKTRPVVWIQDNGTESMSLVEVIDMSIQKGQARVYAAFSFECNTSRTGHLSRQQLIETTETSPFVISDVSNNLVGIGGGVQVNLDGAWLGTTYGSSGPTCESFVTDPQMVPVDGSCNSVGCCEPKEIPRNLQCSRVTTMIYPPGFKQHKASPCSYGMLVERAWYKFSVKDLNDDDLFLRKNPRGVPVVLDFAIRSGTCPAAGEAVPQDYACISGNSSCVNATNGRPGYLCKCWDGYDGNPYIPNGCQDIDECKVRKQHPELQDLYRCSSNGICKNKLGSYECPCKTGMKGNGKNGTCTEKLPLPAKVGIGAGTILAASVITLIVLLALERQKTRKLFRKNGGSIIKHVNSIKIFKKNEIKRITKNYSAEIGKGAFGEVYMGFLDDKSEVAVKVPRKVNKAQKEQFAQEDQFANEIIIQSQIIHKNIVKLVGCCLEVDVPMLVYEFVSGGNLHDTLHGCKKDYLSLDQRLVIAADSADGLAYMHWKISRIILHGDVKPSNILLDNNLIPKISDFGISRLIAIDRAQHAESVIGDLNYIDPVYQQTGLLTRKSDVYSFGVVLLELITRKQVTHGNNNSLVESFVASYKENLHSELFDKQINDECEIKVLLNIAELAMKCLNHDVDQRPEMTDIADHLKKILRERNE